MKLLSGPISFVAWRCVALILWLLGTAGALLVLHAEAGFLPGTVVQGLIGALSLVAWIAAVRFILADTWGRWFWLVVLIGAGALAAFLPTKAGVWAATPLSVFALTFRRYRSWRHIADRRRALGFGLGVLATALLIFIFPRFGSLAEPSGLGVFLKRLGAWSLLSLGCFWFWSLFHLAIKMRLHFMRLRPKLGVTAVLIGLVPLFLMVVLGLMILYTGLGGARAARTTGSLENWRQMTASGVDFGGALFDTTFAWPEGLSSGTKGTPVEAPGWVPGLAEKLLGARVDNARLGRTPATADTTDWFLAGGHIWLMGWKGLDSEQPSVRAWHLGERPLKVLSGLLKVGIDISATSSAKTDDGDLIIGTAGEEDRKSFSGMEVTYRDVSEDKEYWSRFFFFGGTLFEVNRYDGEELDTKNLFINLRVGWQDLQTEFLEGDSNLNIAVVVALGVVAFLFLVLEIFAFFFGVRISEGIVSAVHALHRGTRSVAAGDLDTVIQIPNEDEFGDLAHSFNEMTTAVKHGREIALANDRLKQELETARAIQVRLLPISEPVVTGFEVVGASIPSREIGGDYFDFLAQDNDKIGIAIGDVSGKGMPAALLMSNLQASLHGQVLHPGTVSGVVERVNDLLVKSTDPHMFATFFYGLLDAKKGSFTCTNAGHNPPVLLRNDDRIEELTTGGLLLGMMGEQVYQQDTVELAPGEIIVLYTDGITEAVGPAADEDDYEAMFGEDALFEVMRRNRHLPAAGIKDAILDAVSTHTSGVAQSDDITLVVIRRQG
ncbi:MAG: SpoIIE family protein phosphatase [Candidatus Krumholzibacteriota bacterium]